MDQHYIIEFDGNGRFKKPETKMFNVEQGTKIVFLYSAKQNKSRTPLIITNLNNDNKRTKISGVGDMPSSLDILLSQYNCLEGNYEMNLNWTCLCHLDRPGLYTFQMVFYKEIEEHFANSRDYIDSPFNGYKASQSATAPILQLKVSESLEHIVVNPHYRNSMRKEVDIQRFNFINMVTLFPTMLGKLENWKSELEALIKRGYKGFHFRPIQELGVSKSFSCLKSFNKPNPDIFSDTDYSSLKDLFDSFRSQYNVFFMTDIVLNHCAVDAEWIAECPESYFSPRNTPNLNIAYLLDRKLFELSREFKAAGITESGYIKTPQDVDRVLNYIRKDIVEALHIEEYFMINVDETVSGVVGILKQNDKLLQTDDATSNLLATNFMEKSDYDQIKAQMRFLGKEPFGIKVDLAWLASFLESKLFKLNIYEISKVVSDINKHYQEVTRGWKVEILKTLRAEIEYRFLKLKSAVVNADYPLVQRYFCELSNGDAAALNGWIINYASSEDFTTSQEQYYLRRKIRVWSDLLKLRYEDPKASIWAHMEAYMARMATIFDGFRIDNFHSTKLSAAQHLIKEALKTNQNLYIISVLNNTSTEAETELCTAVGVHRIIREVQNCYSATDIFEMFKNYSRDTDSLLTGIPALAHTTHEISYLMPKSTSAIVYDQTHDNPTYYQKFNIYIQLPIVALINFYNRMVGTCRGFDELFMKHLPSGYNKPYPKVPKKIIVVDRSSFSVIFFINRQSMKKVNEEVSTVELKGSFSNWQQSILLSRDAQGDYWTRLELPKGVYEYKFLVNGWLWTVNKYLPVTLSKSNITNNIILVDRNIRKHNNLMKIRAYFNKKHEQFSIDHARTHMEKLGDSFIMIQRFLPDFRRCYVLITRLCYDNKKQPENAEFLLPGWVHKVNKVYYSDRDYEIVEGDDISLIRANIIEEDSLSRFGVVLHNDKQLNDVLSLKDVPPNFVLVLKTFYPDPVLKVMAELQTNLKISPEKLRKDYLWNMEIRDINFYLYACNKEETEIYKSGNYVVPEYGMLPFAGFAGLTYILKTTSLKMDFEHVLYKHLMEGDYLMDYYMQRMDRHRPNSHYQFKEFYRKTISQIKMMPRFLIPSLFHKLVSLIISGFETQFLQLVATPDFFKNNNLYRLLLLTLPQFMTSDKGTAYMLSAGLPHFSCGPLKDRGRDTFISFKGIFIITGLYKYAREIILHYASYLRHGLIPDKLEPARYNTRDTAWWFIKAVKDYIDTTGDFKILEKKISMRFLSDNKEKHVEMTSNKVMVMKSLVNILHEIFQNHAQGIHFVEWDSPTIDPNTSPAGFYISLYTDWKTGFVMGGTNSNCLTWMNKVGSSHKAGNYGVPATPRVGAPIELTSLLYIGLKFMCMLYNEGYNNWKGVETKKICYSYNQWKKLVAANMERCYWIPENTTEFKNFKIESEFVATRGILKDSYSQSQKDYKLRPNALIAVSLTPKRFSTDKIKSYLRKVKETLIVS